MSTCGQQVEWLPMWVLCRHLMVKSKHYTTQSVQGSIKESTRYVSCRLTCAYTELHSISIEAQKKYFPKPSTSLSDKRSILPPFLISPQKGQWWHYSVFSKALGMRSVRLLPWQCCPLEFGSVRQPASPFHCPGSPQRIGQLSFSNQDS